MGDEGHQRLQVVRKSPRRQADNTKGADIADIADHSTGRDSPRLNVVEYEVEVLDPVTFVPLIGAEGQRRAKAS